MKQLYSLWGKLEEALVASLLALMTLVTFVYVVLNNLYAPMYSFSDWLYDNEYIDLSDTFLNIGDFFIGIAQEMTWSTALTKAIFAWLIFIGISYGVRISGHIGVEVIVKLFPKKIQRVIAIIACGACISYAVFMVVASYDWVSTMLKADIHAEDLEKLGIKLWHIGMIVPIGFALVTLRFLEVFYRIITGQQDDLGNADEAKDAMKHISMDDTENHNMKESK